MKNITGWIYKTDGSQEPLELGSKKRLERLQKIVEGNRFNENRTES